MKTAIVVDLDGTLCDSSHREHLAQSQQWDDFHSACVVDEPHMDVSWLIKNVPPKTLIVALTGRNERYRKVTEDWLADQMILVDDLLMRPDDDYTSDHILKPMMLSEWRNKNPEYGIAFILEDRDKVVEAWRNLGYNCWQVRPGGY